MIGGFTGGFIGGFKLKLKRKAPRSLKCYSCDSSVAHLINQLEGGGCSKTSKIIKKNTDLLKCFFDDFGNEPI